MNNTIHAQYVNLLDNVPFQRIYKTKGRFVAAFKKMKNTSLDHAIDYRNCEVIRPNNFDAYARETT